MTLVEQAGAGARTGARELCRRAGRGLALSWRAAPATATASLVLTLVAGLLPTALAWATKLLLDGLATPAHRVAAPAVIALLLAVAGVFAAVLGPASEYAHAQLQRSVSAHVGDRLFGAVNGFAGMARFEDPVFLDRLRMAQQAGVSAPDRILSAAFRVTQSAVTLIGLFGTLLIISPLMAVAVAAASVPAMVAQTRAGRRRAGMMWSTTATSRRQLAYAMLMTDQHAVQEIRLFGLGDFLRGRMLRHLAEANDAARAVDRGILRSQGPFAVLGALVAGGGLVWAAGQAGSGRLSLGDVSVFIAAVAGCQSALSGLAVSVSDGYQSTLVFGHYLAVVEAPADLPIADPALPLPVLSRGLSLKDVWFRYHEDGPWILRGVDLEIPRGRSVALVGVNGAGKSTLVKLLCRFYDPTRGAIEWDGVDLRSVAVTDLRSRMGAVFQDYMEYDLSAAENIGVGDLARLDRRADIEAAARDAEIDERLRALPAGYDTMLSRLFFAGTDPDDPEAGVRLSGGQWQRVALARGLMRAERDLLILDEPGAGLDAEADLAVHERLRALRAGSTSILISHRLSTVRRADLIVVLDDGRIAEQGTHAELMAAGGRYARLFAIQAEGYQDERHRGEGQAGVYQGDAPESEELAAGIHQAASTMEAVR